MNRINSAFLSKAHIAYLTAGDGGMQYSLEAALALIAGGLNMLEIGIPFSDPIADGPIIQRAAQRSLSAGTTLNKIIGLIEEIRKRSDIPLILFSYLNPILSSLDSSFLSEAKSAGIDGLLIVDAPIEMALKHDLQKQCIQKQIAPIHVISPSTSLDRIQMINQFSQGFLYYACQKGTTGLRKTLPYDFAEKMQLVKSNVQLPVAVGFGISERTMVENVLQHADGAVVGSLFVKAIEEGARPEDLMKLAQSVFS